MPDEYTVVFVSHQHQPSSRLTMRPTLQVTSLIILATCMGSGWHTWPCATLVALWLIGLRITEDNVDTELRELLRG